MSLAITESESETRLQLATDRISPIWLERAHSIPFHALSASDFEIYCFLLLKKEFPKDKIYHYGGTGDGGRDIVHERDDSGKVGVDLIQCKRHESKISVEAIREHMAKVWVNVFEGKIPKRPTELSFYAAPDVTNSAKDLILHQSNWQRESSTAIKKHLKKKVSPELKDHAVNWWPEPHVESALNLTERSRKFPELIGEFFAHKKVIDGSVTQVADEVVERIRPNLDSLRISLDRMEQRAVAPSTGPNSEIEDIKAAFSRSSTGLQSWTTTLSSGRWLERPELQILLDRTASKNGTITLLLGPPGSGKSALLAVLAQRIIAGGRVALAVKVDQLRNSVDSEAKLAEDLNLGILGDLAVREIAKNELVVVLLDQLDAVADLADLKSERLHVLLNLVHKLADTPNVHIVCSCREFEYRHDHRLNRLNAETMQLESPAWKDVQEVLAEHGIVADSWPDDAKSLLRTPYFLGLFLKLLEGKGERALLTTYQQLLDAMWLENVVRPGGGRAELLADLANRLAEREEMWIDRGIFESRWATVESLIAADMLALTQDRFRIGFRHQSLFEFARSKAFASGDVSLAEFVLAREDALFVRPTMWTALTFLRIANPSIYEREFDILWRKASFRHVKHLLADFLSQLESPVPTDRERDWMLELIRDASWRRRALSVITGKRIWFSLLADSHLPAEMLREPSESWLMIWVLVAAFDFDRDRCLTLMRTNWLPDKSKHPHIWQSLTRLKEWDSNAIELALRIGREGAYEQFEMWHLVKAIAIVDPKAAARLLSTWLSSALDRASGADEQKQLAGLIDRSAHWHGIGSLAEAAPVEFASSLWPTLQKIVARQPVYTSDQAVRYTDGHIISDQIDIRECGDGDVLDEFVAAIDLAMRKLARVHPKRFVSLVRKTGNPDVLLLQRIMCRGVRELVPVNASYALEFLMADPRRFWLGGMGDTLSDSLDLIAALGSSLAELELNTLIDFIGNLAMYKELYSGDSADNQVRGFRHRLLSALPQDRLTDSLISRLDRERVAIPEYHRSSRRLGGVRMVQILSPVSQAEMANSSDDEMLLSFGPFPDADESSTPLGRTLGGNRELTFEFEKFAAALPHRALSILEKLRPGQQEGLAAHGIRGLLSSRTLVEIFAAVVRLDAIGFRSDLFREIVADKFDDLASSGGLPDAVCDLLNEWRREKWSSDAQGENEVNHPPKSDESKKPSSFLWEHGRMVHLPSGKFRVLSALTRGYLCRDPFEADEWLGMLRDHVERGENPAIWRSMCRFLGDVRCCPDKEGAREFLARFHTLYPQVVASELGVFFLAQTTNMLSGEHRYRAYSIVRAWDPQAFGELIGHWHLEQGEDVWAWEQIEWAFREREEPVSEKILLGLAFAAANLWRKSPERCRSTQFLVRLISHPNDRIGEIASRVFRFHDDFLPDQWSRALFEHVAASPQSLRRAIAQDMFYEHLLDAFTGSEELVCRIAEEIVLIWKEDERSWRHLMYLASPPLVDISLKLQRSGSGLRKRGIHLFESLLDLEVTEAETVARRNDRRLTSIVDHVAPRRRQR